MRAVADRRPGLGENFQFVAAGIIDARMAADYERLYRARVGTLDLTSSAGASALNT